MRKKRQIIAVLSAALAVSAFTGGMISASGVVGTISPSGVPVEDDRAYYVLKEESSAEYGQDTNSDTVGILASLQKDDKLVLRNVVDLREMQEKSQPFIEILPVVKAKGKAEFTRVTVEAVDVRNTDNYIKIQMSATPQMADTTTTSYFLACASNGQKLSGYESTSGRLHVNNEYGEYSVLSFSGLIGYSGRTGLFYDCDKNTISAVDYRGIKKQIIDFDDPKYFGNYLWSGFSTGEVFCRVYCDNYVEEKATFLVTKYGEYALDDDKINDTKAPVLDIDYGEYEKATVPSALINKEYGVFPASSFDAVDGETATDVKVYINYYSEQKTAVTVSKKGTFTPRMAVPHYIVYSASDARGNKAEEIVRVNVLQTVPDISMTFNGEESECVVGDLYRIPEYTVENALGNPEVTVTAMVGGNVLSPENGAVRPERTGEMKIKYSVKDYVGRTYSEIRTVNVLPAEKPTFTEYPILPEKLVSGNVYRLPAAFARNYVTGNGEEIPTSVFAVENGEERAVADNVYTPGETDSAEIIYRATAGGKTAEYRVVVPVYGVRNGEDIDMAKFFVTDGDGSALAAETGIDLTVREDGTFAFINRVSAVSFKTEFTLVENPNATSRFSVILRDIADSNKKLRFTYLLTGGTAKFYLNDSIAGAVDVNGKVEENTRFSVNFASDTASVYYDISNANLLPVNEWLGGRPFDGFTDNRAYVEYVFEGVSAKSVIEINGINGNYFNDESEDWITPTIDLVGDYGGEYVFGDVVTLPTVVASDVLSGDVDAYVTMTMPSGAKATTVDGKAIDNLLCDGSELKVALTEYGRYLIRITASDSSGNLAAVSPVLRVVDTEKPTLTVSGEIPTEAKVGDNIVVPKATATDNLTEKPEITVFVMTPDGKYTEITDGDAGFRPTTAGIYNVVYVVFDEQGNFASETHKIRVSDKQ